MAHRRALAAARAMVLLCCAAVAWDAAVPLQPVAASPALGSDSEVTDADIQAFHEWFAEAGGVMHDIKLDHVDSDAVGVVATAEVSEGQRVLTVPLDVVIWRNTIVKSAPQRRLNQLYARLKSEDDMFALFLIRERALGDESKWAPYIRVLPRHLPLPLFYTNGELKALQDARATRYALDMKAQSAAQFDIIKGKLRSLLKPLGRETSLKHCTLEMYQWASAIIGSRAVHLSGDRFLVPFADMFNYQAVANFREARDGEHFLRYHRRTKSEFQVHADRSVGQGQQLFEDYGDNSNYVYLNHHGFVPDDNPFDCVEILLPKLESAPPPAAPVVARRSLLKRLQLHPPITTCLRPGPVPEEVQQYLSLWSLDAAGVDRCRAILRGSGRSASESTRKQCLGSELPTAAYEEVQRFVLERLRSFPTSISQDEAILKSGPSTNTLGFTVRLSANERLAIKFRLTRKRLLAALHEHFSSLAALGGEEWPSTSSLQDFTTGRDLGASSTRDGATSRAARARAARLHHIVGRFNEWLRTGGKRGGGLVRGGVLASVIDPTQVAADSHATHSEGRLVAVAEHGLREAEMVAVSMSAVMSPNSALRQFPVSERGVWAALQRAEAQAGPHFSEHPEDWFTARDQALVLHLITEALRQPHPLGDALHRRARADAGTGKLDLLDASSSWPGLPEEASRWQHFLALLPGPAHTASPLLFEPAALDVLQGSPVRCLAQRRIDLVKGQFEHLRRTVLAKFPEVFSPQVFNEVSYTWARAVLDARAHWWDGDRHLVPLLELPLLHRDVRVESAPHVDLTASFAVAAGHVGDGNGGTRDALRRLREARLRHAAKLTPDTTGDWVMAHTWRPAVGGERLATPPTSFLPRHTLLLNGHHPPPHPREASLAGTGTSVAASDASVATAFNASSQCPPVVKECLYIQLAICDEHPDYELQAARLWHAGLYSVRIEGCVTPAMLYFGPSACADVQECGQLLAFVRAATGVSDDATAHAALIRLLAAMYQHTNWEAVSRIGAGSHGSDATAHSAEGDGAGPHSAGTALRLGVARQFRLAERCFLHVANAYVHAPANAAFFETAASDADSAAGKGGSATQGVDGSNEASADDGSALQRGRVCMSTGSDCGVEDDAASLEAGAAPSTGADPLVGHVAPSRCGLCVTASQVGAASAAAVRTEAV